MQLADVIASARKHRWWLAFLAIVIAGYSIGKDVAMRDNRADAVARGTR